MARLTPHYSSNRMLREYVAQSYLPATVRFRERTANAARLARELVAWHQALEQRWSELRFGSVQVQRGEASWIIQVPVHLGALDPAFVRVELYAEAWKDQSRICQPLVRGKPLPDGDDGYLYYGSVPASRPVEHFTPRIIPMHPSAQVPLEARYILWQR
jgi:starch phosphorylase